MRPAVCLARVWVVVLLLAGLWGLQAVPVAVQGLTFHPTVSLKRVQDATLTDDGKTVVFTRNRPADPREKNEPADTHLFTVLSRAREEQ